MGAPHISWSPKMHLRFNNFRVWHLFVACLYFSSASLLLYIFHYASVPHFYMCCSFSSSPSPAMFLWVQRLLRSALFVKLRITFYYSSWVNIKFNMMHQINVCSVFCFFSVLGFKDHLTLVFVLFRFLTLHVLRRCRPRRWGSWTNFHVTPLEATIFPAKDWDNYQSNTSAEKNLIECVWKVFPSVGCRVESSCLLRKKGTRLCVEMLRKLDTEKNGK